MMFQLRVYSWFFIAISLMGPVWAQGQALVFATGLEFTESEEYEQLPKATKYRAALPERVDLSSRFPEPGSQGRQGSCVAWAVAYGARSYYESALSGARVNSSAAFSPAYIYNQIRIDRSNCSSGSNIRRALDLLKKQGVARLDEFPYSEDECVKLPSAQIRASAARNLIRDWRAIKYGQIETVKGELYRGHPVIVGMSIPDSFSDVRGTSIFNDASSSSDGGHAMTIVGYDDKRGAFKLLNSWGKSWGDGGYGWVDYDAMSKRGREYFVMVVDAPPKPPAPPPPPSPPIPSGPSQAVIRQDVRSLVGQMECSAIEVDVSAQGQVVLKGFTGDIHKVDELMRSVRGVAGVKSVVSELTLAPWPQCEAYLTLASLRRDPRLLSVALTGRATGPTNVLKEGESFSFDITPQNTGGYVYISYLQANGDQIPLIAGQAYPRGQILKLPPAGTGRIYSISAPFGDELLIVITSPKQLFPKGYVQGGDREYLSMLRRVILNLSPAELSQLTVALLPIQTVPR
jgi:hypothetical protein